MYIQHVCEWIFVAVCVVSRRHKAVVREPLWTCDSFWPRASQFSSGNSAFFGQYYKTKKTQRESAETAPQTSEHEV